MADNEELQNLRRQAFNVPSNAGTVLARSSEDILCFVSWSNEFEMLDQLGGMLDVKVEALEGALRRTTDCASSAYSKRRRKNTSDRSCIGAQETIREDVREMIEIYLEGKILQFNLYVKLKAGSGQLDILQTCIMLQEKLFYASKEKAGSEGFEIEEEEEGEKIATNDAEDKDQDSDEEEGDRGDQISLPRV